MADMTKCTNDDCPASGHCYRRTVPADPEYQADQRFEPDEGAIPWRCLYYVRDESKSCAS